MQTLRAWSVGRLALRAPIANDLPTLLCAAGRGGRPLVARPVLDPYEAGSNLLTKRKG